MPISTPTESVFIRWLFVILRSEFSVVSFFFVSLQYDYSSNLLIMSRAPSKIYALRYRHSQKFKLKPQPLKQTGA